VSLAEWQAGRGSENLFLTVKDDDTADTISKAKLETYITNSTLTAWYDQDSDDEIAWVEWISFVIDQNMWTMLDADSDHHVSAEEFTAQGMDGALMVKWL
jgi:hypothetical protein